MLQAVSAMTVQELINLLVLLPKTDRVVAEYDSGLYPVISVNFNVIGQYPKYDLREGERVVQIVYEEYQ